MKRLAFETHIGHFHSLALVKTQYPLLRFMDIFDIGCHIICAMDEVLNLHFIQFRDKEKYDPDIFPPSGAITGHSKILFSFEILAIYQQVFGKSTSEADFLELFTALDHMYRNKPEICSVRPGVFLFKPTKGGNTYLFDLTMRDNKPVLVSALLGVELLSAVDQDVIVFTSTVLQGIFLYHFGNFKMKKLLFSQKNAQVIQVIKQRRLCVSISNNILEILDLRRNKILEKSVYESSSVNMLAVSPSGNRLIHAYYHGKVTEGVMRMEIWDLNELKIVRGETYILDESQTIDHSIAFLNEEIFVHVRMWTLSVFRIEEHGLCKLQTLRVPNNYGYVHSGKEGHCVWSQICLLTNELNSFLLLTSDVFEDRYNRIEHYKLIEEQEELELSNEENTNMMPQVWGEGKASKDSVQIRSTLKAQTILLYLEKVDFIQFTCVWEDDKIGILYESFRFYEYNLLSGDLTKVMGISGLKNSEESLKKIKYINKNVLGLFYEKDDSQKQRLILIDLQSRKTIFDTKDLKRNDYLIKVSCIEVMLNGWIALVYRKNDSSQEILGLLDFEKGEVDDLFKFDHGRSVNEIWSIGSQYLAGRLKRHGDTLIIVDLVARKIVKEKRLKSIEQIISKNTNEAETYFWAVTRLTDQIIAFAISKPEAEDTGVIIYNWVEETINGLCRVNVEDIYGVMNNELFICLEEAFPQDCETFFATIPIQEAMRLKDDSQENLPFKLLEFEYFGKFFFGFEKSLFGILKNRKQATIVMKQFFPHYICIMRKRSKKVEILRYIKKQIGALYHPYVIQDIVKMITPV